jgi:hypothetical protein
MSRERIPVGEAARVWLKDPEFRAEYEALRAAFALASALIEAKVAEAMGTSKTRNRRPRNARCSRFRT